MAGAPDARRTPEASRGPETHPGRAEEVQLTTSRGGHVLTNVNVFSPDGRWIVYDTRPDAEGALFEGETIEQVHVETGEVQVLYRARHGARCGVATYDPAAARVVFIRGPEHPTPDWSYSPTHRQGVVVETARPGVAWSLDARDRVPPFTPGALRGGSHVHVFGPDGWASFTYQDAVLEELGARLGRSLDRRGVGVSAPVGPVRVPPGDRNHDGELFTVLVTRSTPSPRAGSDEISWACEEGWVGTAGYRRADGTWQRRALAFQGHVVTPGGATISEVFLVDVPDDVTVAGPDGPLEGTATTPPAPPRGCVQRRLTHTAARRHPGLQGPRHWLRATPDGARIAYLARDDDGWAQLWTVSPLGGPPTQVTRHPFPVASAFTWSPDGRYLAYAADTSIFVTEAATGRSVRLTPGTTGARAPLPLAVVWSPDGRAIAFQRRVQHGAAAHNQICLLRLG